MEILVIFALIIINGFLAMSEIAILSASKPKLKSLAQKGNQNAQSALKLINNSSVLLSSVQIGITLVGVVAGAFGGYSLASPLADYLSKFDLLFGYHDLIAYALVVSLITYFSIVFGELVPKRLAISNALSLTLFSAPWINRLSKISAPLVKLLSVSTNIIVTLIPWANKEKAKVSEEDVLAMIHEGVVIGIFEPSEKKMFERMLHVGDTPVSEMMVPCSEVVWLDIRQGTRELRKTITTWPHYYYPVCDGSVENIVGIIRAEDILTDFLDDIKITLDDILMKPQYIDEDKSGITALEQYKVTGIHLAFVKDGNGQVTGIITSNDIMDTIAGGLPEVDEM